MLLTLQLSSGRGPLECQRACWLLLKALNKEAETLGLAWQLLQAEEGADKNCLLSATFTVEGESAQFWADNNIGSQLWVCRSPFRPTHKRKNWFVDISLIPSVESLKLDMSQVRVDSFRASGAGGQHVNTTDSAIRATWLPQNIAVCASEERSQHRNRALALQRLALAVEKLNEQQRASQDKQANACHDQLQRGTPCRTWEGEKFQEK